MESVEKYLKSWASNIVRQQKGILQKKDKNATGKLSRSLKYKLSNYSDGYILEFFMVPYGKFIDKGVRGKQVTRTYIDITGKRKRSPYRYKSKQPPTKVFDKWLIKRGIAPRDKAGKFMSRKALKFLIARSVYKKGIQATSFFSKPFALGFKNFTTGLLDAVEVYFNNNIDEINN